MKYTKALEQEHDRRQFGQEKLDAAGALARIEGFLRQDHEAGFTSRLEIRAVGPDTIEARYVRGSQIVASAESGEQLTGFAIWPAVADLARKL